MQHSVHYIAGPETGYRVLKNVKGPHFPNVYPFSAPDYYDPYDKTTGDVFIPEETGRPRPVSGNRGTAVASEDTDKTTTGEGADGDYDNAGEARPDYGGGGEGGGDFGSTSGGFEGSTTAKPFGARPSTPGRPRPSRPGSTTARPRPPVGGNRPIRPSYDDDDGEDVDDLDLFGGIDSGSSTFKPQTPTSPGSSSSTAGGYDDYEGQRPSSSRPPVPSEGPSGADDFGLFGSETGDNRRPIYGSGTQDQHKPTSVRPGSISTTAQPPRHFGDFQPSSEGSLGDTDEARDQNEGIYGPSSEGDFGGGKQSTPGGQGFGTSTPPSSRRPGGRRPGQRRPSVPSYGEGESPPAIGVSSGGGFSPDLGTIVRNLGDKIFSVPPGASVRAHVQAIDLIPLDSRIPSPSEQFKAETTIQAEGTDVVINTTEMNLKQSTVF